MKHIYLFFLQCIIIAAHAQHVVPHTVVDLPKGSIYRPAPPVLNDSREENKHFLIDYGAIDERYALENDHAYSQFIYEMNKRFPNSATFTFRDVVVNFDSLVFLNEITNNINARYKDKPLRLDSIHIPFFNKHTTSNRDTLIIKVLKGSTLQSAGSGTSATLFGQIIWKDTTYISETLAGGNNTILKRYPKITVDSGEWFAIKMEFMGDTANKFYVAATYRNACEDFCWANSAAAGQHSFPYVNFIDDNSGTNFSGINSFITSCDPGIPNNSDEPCVQFFPQNISIFPYVTYDPTPIDTTTIIDTTTTAIKAIGNTTVVKVFPNPFKNQTNFELGKGCKGASLKIYNVNGQLVDQKDNLAEGTYTYQATKLSAGLYSYIVVTPTDVLAKGKLLLE